MSSELHAFSPPYVKAIAMNQTLLSWISGMGIALSCVTGFAAEIVVDGNVVQMHADLLTRRVELGRGSLRTVDIRVDGKPLLARPAREVMVRVRKARPNRRPVGLRVGEGKKIDSQVTFRPGYREDPTQWEDRRPNAVQWVEPVIVSSDDWAGIAGTPRCEMEEPDRGASRLTIRTVLADEASFGRLAVTLCYEVYARHSAIRKWVKIDNLSDRWLMLDRLTIDDLSLAEHLRHAVPLTPAEGGAESSLTAFDAADGSFGVIAASEVPSALRSMGEDGRMGYREELFEWVLAPGESFVSEPVFLYAYAGQVQNTPSARSTPRDRAVEGPYMEFLKQYLGIGVDAAPIHAPQWMTWATFYHTIDDAIVRSRAELAAQAGFAQILLDDGWQRGRLGTEPDRTKFPDFAATSRFVRERGLGLGLWVSCYRDADSEDLRKMPDGGVVPVVTRLGGKAMSFSSSWRQFYADSLVKLHRDFGATYFKQDFSNIRFGDFAEGHEGRSMRDSLLRGLRGLLEAQVRIRTAAPDVVTELTHEIYWGTPGVPCDLAALKHARQYHIPPNRCRGADPNPTKRVPPWSPTKHRTELQLGCFEARERFYAHRGLPLHCLEYYGAATYSVDGSLTPALQDRQIASFLMGAPLTFSGDLATLSEENIAHYQRRFELLRRLQDQYDIYRHFQFSGVPPPTDTDWHWWGKLNDDGCGAVVVVRGRSGEERRAINIPWAARNRQYRITACLAGKTLGDFTGAELQDAGVSLALPPLGQEILELAKKKPSP